jgi:hypothetical protein
MQNQDDEFWTAYIAATAEQDKDFAPMAKPLAWVIVGALAFAALCFCFVDARQL